MPDANSRSTDLITALNARDYATIAALCDEDVAISGLGGGSDTGRDALRDRLARHFSTFDETYGDAVAMQAAGGSPLAIRVTARGRDASGQSYATEKVLLMELDGGTITRLSLLADASDLARQLTR